MLGISQLTPQSSIRNVAETYSRRWNFGLAANIQRKLPQELRDMIYRELVLLQNPGESAVERERKRYSGATVGRTILLSTADYPHWFDVVFMGSDFATELSRYFHSTKKFLLQHPDELEVFLSKDRFKTPCIPSTHHTLVLRVDHNEHNDGRQKFAEVLVRIVYDLKAKGWTVRVEDANARSQSEINLAATMFNYDIPRSDWVKKIKNDSAFVSP
ncbi:hypothetical protein DE146DRAFT_624190 [Phaeosphaeria sp. MPI-PUGE-AT-0046c]|nr:hypothetical protein DE146DRAFT_624190 [Phaeosphaeria sp. MPI-PUGE-AT-0046c]